MFVELLFHHYYFFHRFLSMMRIFALLNFVYLLLVFGRRIMCERLDFQSGLVENSAWYPEGITLELHCRNDSMGEFEIRSDTKSIVKGSNLVHGMTKRYGYYKNLSSNVLIIKRLSREDEAPYICQNGVITKFAQIRVLYSPSDKSPQCTSNYDSPVIFDDIRQNYINFSCTTEEGNPPVLMTLTAHESEHFQNISDLSKLCIVDQNFDYTKTLFCNMNESLANTTFLCDVTQQFPSPYSGSYRGSCSFGPLQFLSNFSVKVSEPFVTVTVGEELNLTCITNVTGVKIKWDGIPVDWEKHVSTSDNLGQMWIKNVKRQSPSEITVQCIGSFGHRNVTDSVKITIEGKPFGHEGETILLVTLLLLILVIIVITFSFGCYARKRGISWSLGNKPDFDHNTPQNTEVNAFHMETTASMPNKNNANNTAIKVCDGDEECDSDPLNDPLDDTMVSDMHDNPVYEPASIAANVSVSESTVDQYAVVSKQDSKVEI